MICKVCKSSRFKVDNSWKLDSGYIKRSRTCQNCGWKLITLELPEEEFIRHIRLVKDLKRIVTKFMKK